MKKVILVTGASSGIGLSISNYLSDKEYVVYGTSRSIQGEFSFRTLKMDVSSTESVGSAVDTILKKEGRIDVLINNAGLGLASPVENLVLEDVEKLFNTNVFGILRTIQAVLPAMRKQNKGLIINISSIGSEIGLPYRGVYSATKAGLDRITESLRMEVKGFGIQACTVQPGGIATDRNNSRLLSPLPENSPYKNSFERTYEIINESVSGGLNPMIFGPAIEKIILSPKVKRNYRIGKPTEKLSVLLKRILPDYLFERIIMGHYDM